MTVTSFLRAAIVWMAALVSGLILIGVAATMAAAPNIAVSPTASESARTVLLRARVSVVQIVGFFGSSTAKSFHGTGWAISADGLFITNYHVVSEHVQLPDKYRLEYLTTDNKTGKATVLAIDVRNDLALVRLDGYAPPALAIEPKAPAKGDRAYSVGFPLDVGLTITEGVSNGLLDDVFQPRIHYSGALNGGMSGGPAFNDSGQVMGINVSGYLFQQLVSFLVPVQHARELADKVPAQAPTAADLKTQVQDQTLAHAQDLLAATNGPITTQKSLGYALPSKLAPFIECNAAGDSTPNQPVETLTISCAAKAGLYLQQGLSSGSINYQHTVLSTSKIGAWRFASRLTALTAARPSNYLTHQHAGPFACDNNRVSLKGFDADVVVCVRAYRKLPKLYDFSVRISSLSGSTHGFASTLDMSGMDFDGGTKFVQRYLEAMEWTP
jgi:serine protease Do